MVSAEKKQEKEKLARAIVESRHPSLSVRRCKACKAPGSKLPEADYPRLVRINLDPKLLDHLPISRISMSRAVAGTAKSTLGLGPKGSQKEISILPTYVEQLFSQIGGYEPKPIFETKNLLEHQLPRLGHQLLGQNHSGTTLLKETSKHHLICKAVSPLKGPPKRSLLSGHQFLPFTVSFNPSIYQHGYC